MTEYIFWADDWLYYGEEFKDIITMNLRPYQSEAIEAVLESFEESTSSLVVMPTGTGKTIMFAHLAERFSVGRVMVVAHREELIFQAANKIEAIVGHRPDIEMGEYQANRSLFTRNRIVISSIQTQIAGEGGNGRMTRFRPDDFVLLIIDECHHAISPSYRKVIDHYRKNPDLKILGVTATPDRADESALGQVFDTVAYDYEILDAVNDGYLVPIEQRSVIVEDLDFSKIRTTAGDLNQGDLAKVMDEEIDLHKIAAPTYQLADGRKTLVFTVSVAGAERMCEIFNRHEEGCARWVCGMTPKEERKQTLKDYAADKFQFLVNVGCFTEGFDEPSIQVVAIARPTKSRSLYAQMVGRGTRVLPGVIDLLDSAADRVEAITLSSKTHLEVIDFVGNAGKHKLASCSDILGGKYSDEIVARASEIASAESVDESVDVVKQLEQAEEEIHEQKKRAAERKMVVGKATYSSHLVDPFNVLDIEPQREKDWHRGKMLSSKQINYLQRAGVQKINELTYTEATQLIGKMMERYKDGLCSYAQARVLRQAGHEPKGIRSVDANEIINSMPCSDKQANMLKRYGYGVENVTRPQASKLIDAIANNGWKRPLNQGA